MKKKYGLNKNRAQNKKHLFCILYFVDVFYNMKCLRNTYFLNSILLNMKKMLVFIFIIFFFGFKFWPPPGMNPGSVPEDCIVYFFRLHL